MSDQFAFRPTGSITAALVLMLHHLTDMATKYDYVHLIAPSFFKAFDTVRHSSLKSKIADIPTDDQVYNCLVDFLSGWQHITKHKGNCSASLSINSTIVQGSGIEPVMYIINASDIHPNIMLKYVYLLKICRAMPRAISSFFALIKCAHVIFQISDRSQTLYKTGLYYKQDQMQFYTAIYQYAD